MKLYFLADITVILYILLYILGSYPLPSVLILFLSLSLSLPAPPLRHKLVLQIPELEYLRLCLQNSLEPQGEYDTKK